ncbi:MAG: NAD(P)/FAD-dependent oxidoreductase, partial [Candidatus Micrarchaeaceae archaeon]
MEEDKEIKIVGAGVIGLTLASKLANEGLKVEVFDSKKSVREGANKASGILSKSGLEETGLNYRQSVINTLKGAILHAGNETLKVKAKDDMAFVLDRGKLAELCYKDAKEAGAEIELGRRVSKEELIKWERERKIIVGADGAVSTVANTFGFPGIKEYALTYKVEYSNARVEDKEMVGLFFNSRIHRFFGWSVPYSAERLELGIGISNRAKRSSANAFEEFVKEKAVTKLIVGARMERGYASIIPLSIRKETVRGNVMLIGDAAGQVKATTGGGIIFGTLCAGIAARVIMDNIKGGLPLSNYETIWRKQ